MRPSELFVLKDAVSVFAKIVWTQFDYISENYLESSESSYSAFSTV